MEGKALPWYSRFMKKKKNKNEVIDAGSLRKYDFQRADQVVSLEGCSPCLEAHLAAYIGHCVFIYEGDGE